MMWIGLIAAQPRPVEVGSSDRGFVVKNPVSTAFQAVSSSGFKDLWGSGQRRIIGPLPFSLRVVKLRPVAIPSRQLTLASPASEF